MPQREDRSPSETPLPADHSAAADVMNTPTTGMSPKVVQTSLSIDEEREEATAEKEEYTTHSSRSALMRSLLRPRPIPEVENFGIPSEPEGEVDPDVQVLEKTRNASSFSMLLLQYSNDTFILHGH